MMNMDWKELYDRKIVTAEQAVRKIKSNDNVVFSQTAAVPLLTAVTLYNNKELYDNVNIYHMFTLGHGAYMKPECYGHFRHFGNFVASNSRQALMDKQADFIPCYFHEVPKMFKESFTIDVAVIAMTTPDKNGYCSFGLSCDYSKAAAKSAKILIAEMNEMMPFTMGEENRIHISEIDYVLPCSYFLPEIPLPTITEIENNIGKYCASMVNDGATVQLGIGAIPHAVALYLSEKNDLGVHTEMFSDSLMELIKKGVVNNSKKNINKDKSVSAFIMGTNELYDFVNNNADIELFPVDYVNDPYVISQNDNVVSINSCLEIDLMGQVNSETIGLSQYSGVGGQVDFVRGARRSKNGLSIMAMPSTASKGAISRIVPFLSPGAAVTTSRNDVDVVVTEYGVANLRYKTLAQRAESLIAIAHPDFREELLLEFEKRF